MSRTPTPGSAARHGPRSPRGLRLSARRRFCRPLVELLEDRTLLAALAGTVFNDVNGNGVHDGTESRLAGVPVFLDLNHDGKPDSVSSTFTATAPAGQSSIPLGGDPFGFGLSAPAPLVVSGVPQQGTHLRVGLDLDNGSPDPVLAVLFSPAGQTQITGPNLVLLAPGQHFAGTFDDQAAQRVSTAQFNLPAGTSELTGTYQPDQPFSAPANLIYQGDPNDPSGWLLLLVDPNNGPVLPGVTLNSWSLTFDVPEPSAVTDAAGNYSFTGLAAGSYDVGVSPPPADVQTFPAAPNLLQHVSLADGQSQGGVDFGVQAAPDLAGVSFRIEQPPTDWGQPVTVDYTVGNQGQGAAGPFQVDLRLSATGTIDASSLPLTSFTVDGLAAGATASGTLKVQLPGSPGFAALDRSSLGLLIDPANAVAETSEANNANQGSGIDEAPLASPQDQALIPPQDQALGTEPGVQQQPSVAVDPHNPDRVAVAYLDYSQGKDGYAGIAVASSSDGGATWQYATVPLPSGFDEAAGYPSVKFDDQGHLLISFMAATFLGRKPPLIFLTGVPDPGNNGLFTTTDLFTANNGIFVAESDDGGQNWGAPVPVVSNLYTGTPVLAEAIPDLAVDTFPTLPDGSPNPNYGNVYVTWTRYYPAGQFPGDSSSTDGSDVLVAVSNDHGQTWTPQVLPTQQSPPGADSGEPGTGFVDFSHVTVGPLGDVYASAAVGGAFWVFRSTDGGQTFTGPSGLGDGAIPLPSTFPTKTLNGDQFRTDPVRQLVADPTRPGVVYAVEAIQTGSGNDNQVAFAVSHDGGQYWDVVTDLSGRPSVLNSASQPIVGQALPHLAVDEHGNVSIIWYDARRDPNGNDLDVFGTVSTDGGQTFSPDFRLSSTTFDPNAGAFADALGQQDFFLGDATGLASADGVAYAAWTDTRAANQDIHVERFQVAPAPAALGDRFEPNNTPDAATELGPVLALQTVPALTLTPGDDDWYRVEPSSGVLEVTTSEAAGQHLLLELYDATGTQFLATGTDILSADGQVIGEQLSATTTPGQKYLIHVAGVPASAVQSATYSLGVQSLAGDLLNEVDQLQPGSLPSGGQDTYRFTVQVDGTLAVTATAGGDFGGAVSLNVLRADGTSLLPGQVPVTGYPTASASVAVRAGDVVLLQVSGGQNGMKNSYTLGVTNLDQLETPNPTALFFPTQATPTALATADLNGDGQPDLVAANADTSGAVDVLLGNADGTFQASRGFDAGPGGNTRGLAIDRFNKDGAADVAVTDFSGDGVSVLLGNGDGTLQPARPFDATLQPGAVAAGDFNGDGVRDLAVLQKFSAPGAPQQLAVLLGRGDGTFLPPTFLTTTFVNGGGTILVGDFNGDGHDDIAAFSFNDATVDLFLGNGDGTFAATPRTFRTGENVAAAQAVDLGNGALDLITTGTNDAVVSVLMNDGHGNFSVVPNISVSPDQHGVAQEVTGVAVADVTGPGGVPDGIPDLIATVAPRFGAASPQLFIVPGQVDAQGHFAGFANPQLLATGRFAGPLAVGDFNGDKVPDIAAAVTGGVEILYGKPLSLAPNTTQATARDLGTVFHYVSPAETIVPDHENAWFKLTAPTEPTPDGRSQVLDFSAAFAAAAAAGLSMEVLDESGKVLGTGPRFRVLAAQGQVLYLHVFGKGGTGTGTFTLDVDALPQVTSVQAEALLPGGPTTSLVLSLQGDRLDPATAQDPANYTVTWLGPDDQPGTADDQVIALKTGAAGSPPVLYDPDANVNVSTGATYPTASRQTVTLQFDQPLPAGSYEITLSDGIQAAAFTAGEAGLLAGDNSLTDAGAFAGHPVVSVAGFPITNGSTRAEPNLVPAAGGGDLAAFASGTPFLGQLHDDLGALLADVLTAGGDSANTAAVSQEIRDRVGPGLGASRTESTQLTDAIHSGTTHFAIGTFDLSLSDVTPQSRGGAVVFHKAGDPGQGLAGLVVIWLDPVSVNLADPAGDRVTFDLQQGSLTDSISTAFVSMARNIEVLVLPINRTQNISLPPSGPGPAVAATTAPGSSPAVAAGTSAPGSSHAVAPSAILLGAVFGRLATGLVVQGTQTQVAANVAVQATSAGPAPVVAGRAGVPTSIDSGQAFTGSELVRAVQAALERVARGGPSALGGAMAHAAGGLRGLVEGSSSAVRAVLRPLGLAQLPVVSVPWRQFWDIARGVVLDTVKEVRAALPAAPPAAADPAAAPDRVAPAATPNQGRLPPAEHPGPVEGLSLGKASLAAALFVLGLARPWLRDWVAARRPGARKRCRRRLPDSPEGAA